MYEIVKVLEKQHFTKTGRPMSVVMARCLNCGETREMLEQNAVKSNRNKRAHCASCIGQVFHRMTHTRPYNIWRGARSRCNDTSDPNYGGRGIRMCHAWLMSFAAFWRDMGPTYSDSLTLERIDKNGNYTPSNCCWDTNAAQQANKRNNRVVSYRGMTLHLAELVRLTGFSKVMLLTRLNQGMTGDEAVEDARRSTYGKGRKAKQGRMSTTWSRVARVTGS